MGIKTTQREILRIFDTRMQKEKEKYFGVLEYIYE
jgi:hypothetical protein